MGRSDQRPVPVEDDERFAMRQGDMPPPVPERVANPRIREDRAVQTSDRTWKRCTRATSGDACTKACPGETVVRRIMIIMEGQGCGWACGRRVFLVSVSCFFFFTMVSNGVDRMRLPCSALNVKVVRKSKQAQTNDRRNHEPRLL